MKNLSEAVIGALEIADEPVTAKEIAEAINHFDDFKQFRGTSSRSVVVCLTFALSGSRIDRITIKGQRASLYRLRWI